MSTILVINTTNEALLGVFIENKDRLISKLQDERKRLEKRIPSNNNLNNVEEINELISHQRIKKDKLQQSLAIRKGILTKGTIEMK